MSDYTASSWGAPGQPPPGKKPSPLLLLLIPVAACLFLAVVAGIIGAVAGTAQDEEPTATKATTTTEAPAEVEPVVEATEPEPEGPGEQDFAKCQDGSYSDNPELHNTCSSHDGVDEWLAEFGECEDGSVIALSNDPECPDRGDLARLLPGHVPAAGPEDIAECKDGTFSDNRELHNTCSSHDGVESWLADYGRCADGEIIPMTGDPSCGGDDLAELMPPDYTPPTTTAPPPTVPPPVAAPPAAPPPTQPAAPAESVSQQNARAKAADYLDFSSFSRQGLIDQLLYEGFSDADATYGVDAQGADWNEQAAKKAADYLDFSSFSRQGLIDQLIYEGFSPAEAEYGVSTTGL